ncbi:MAG: flagellar hook-associated protein FlgK [Myxococcota bacterium]
MSLLTSLQAARRGIQVASEGINVTSHNTTNATTPGYTRRTMKVSTMSPLQRNGVYLGQGAQTLAFRRVADRFVDARLVDAQSAQARSKSAYETLSLLESRLADGTAGSIQENYSSFLDALQLMASDPADTGRRYQVVETASQFTSSVKETTSFFTDMQGNIKDTLESSVSALNGMLVQIADLNGEIGASGGSLGAADLIDQRNALIEELSLEVGVKAQLMSNGQAVVFLDGHPLVQDDFARSLSYGTDSNGDPQILVSASSGTIDITDGLGGDLRGRLDAYDDATVFKANLSTFVTDFSTAFNTQHAAGFDKNGNPGGDFFNFDPADPLSSFDVTAAVIADTTLIAAAGNATAFAGDHGNLDSLHALQDSLLFNGGTTKPGTYISELYTDIARGVADAERDYDVNTTRFSDLSEMRAAISGVNFDEEASNLMHYQASYEAAARVITVSNGLLGTLMEIV